MTNIAQEIVETLKSMGDKKIADHSRRFFKTGAGEYGAGDQFLGIRVPVVRKVAGKYKKITPADACRVLKSEFHEARLCALIILVEKFKGATEQERKEIYQYYLENTRYINNWDLVDTSADKIVGAYLFNNDTSKLYTLVKSTSLWERRIAVMATFYFIKQGSFDDTVTIARLLLGDQEDLIHKAVGWMLREVGKRDFSCEERFLLRHYKNMPRTMLRYAIEKFPEKERKMYLAGTK